MSRRELYQRVWAAPRTKLAPELGLSDVGLTKLCRRHGIPVPPVGYWARVAAGQTLVRPPLPKADADVEIEVPSHGKRAQRVAAAAEVRKRLTAERAYGQTPSMEVVMPATLEGCLPVVKRTEKYFRGVKARLEAQERRRTSRTNEPFLDWISLRTACGRYTPDEEGCLWVTAFLTDLDWILRFHEALLRAIAAGGVKIHQQGPSPGQAGVSVGVGEEAVYLKFSQDYEKRISKRMRGTWESNDTEYVPTGVFRVKMERRFAAPKLWRGSAKDLELLLPTIVSAFLAAPALQAQLHAEHEQREAERREIEAQTEARRKAFFAAQELVRAQKAARNEQIKRLSEVAASLARYRREREVIGLIEQCARASDPVIRQWLALVRQSLHDPVKQLVEQLIEEGEGPDKPLWWIDDTSGPEDVERWRRNDTAGD